MASMTSGVARYIRADNSLFRFVTLDLDERQPLPHPQIIETVLSVFGLCFGPEDHPKSFAGVEFTEKNGILHIPRIVTNQGKDQYVVQGTGGPAPEPQRFLQTERPLKSRIAHVGLLGSVYYGGDQTLILPIRANEVEIAVVATDFSIQRSHDILVSNSILSRNWHRV